MVFPPSSSIQSPVEGLEEYQSAELMGQRHRGEFEEEIRTFPYPLIEPVGTANDECHRESDIALLHQKLRKIIGRHIFAALIERNEHILATERFEQLVGFFLHLPLWSILFTCSKFLNIEHR